MKVKNPIDGNRDSLLKKNTISGIILQVITLICGFILPRAILNTYGSETNGLVNSISQFLQMIAFAELGMGAVLQSALYKPLADKDYNKISEILSAGNNFFRKIGLLLLLYVLILCVIFPCFIDNNSILYDGALIIAISISYFAQYYFGLVDRLFINAIQKAYIQNQIYIITLLINTIACYILIYTGFSIISVKLLTSIVFLLRPFLVRKYIQKNYKINRKARFNANSIPQKWNGIAQHVAAIVLDSTDTIVLSLLSSLTNVSIYAVYNIVISGIKQLFTTAFGGISALIGDLWANDEIGKLNTYFENTEKLLHFVTLFFWITTYRLIVPFVTLYTSGVRDANYNAPEFAFVICLASILFCYRLSYNSLILAVGHYKQTQMIFIIAASINLFSSIILVKSIGLIGVAIGTLIAMIYQYTSMQWYCIKQLKVYSYKKVFEQYSFDALIAILSMLFTHYLKLKFTSWWNWVINAVIYSLVIFAICSIVSVIRYLFGIKRKNNIV